MHYLREDLKSWAIQYHTYPVQKHFSTYYVLCTQLQKACIPSFLVMAYVSQTGTGHTKDVFAPTVYSDSKRSWHSWSRELGSTPRFQFSSVARSCLTLCDPMDCSTPCLPVYHQLLEFVETQVHWVGDAIQPSPSLSSPSPPAFNLSQHQGLFQWVSSHQVAKVLKLQFQHQSFQWIFRIDLL